MNTVSPKPTLPRSSAARRRASSLPAIATNIPQIFIGSDWITCPILNQSLLSGEHRASLGHGWAPPSSEQSGRELTPFKSYEPRISKRVVLQWNSGDCYKEGEMNRWLKKKKKQMSPILTNVAGLLLLNEFYFLEPLPVSWRGRVR